MLKVVIFDCDGVLLNSEDAVFNYYNTLLTLSSLPLIDRQNRYLCSQIFSMTDIEILKLLSNGENEIFNKLTIAAKSYIAPRNYQGMTLTTGIVELLQYLKSKNIKLAVLTNRGSSLPRVLDHFNIGIYFDKLVTSADPISPKPSPDGVYNILTHFNINSDEAIFIGDSETDYFAAKSSNVKFIAFRQKLYEATTIEEFLEIKNFVV